MKGETTTFLLELSVTSIHLYPYTELFESYATE